MGRTEGSWGSPSGCVYAVSKDVWMPAIGGSLLADALAAGAASSSVPAKRPHLEAAISDIGTRHQRSGMSRGASWSGILVGRAGVR
jgi:hypothetical protein